MEQQEAKTEQVEGQIIARLKARGCIMRIEGQDISDEWRRLLREYPSPDGKNLWDAIKTNAFQKPIWLDAMESALRNATKPPPPKPPPQTDPWGYNAKIDAILARFPNEAEIIKTMGFMVRHPTLREHYLANPSHIKRTIDTMMNGQCP